MMKNILLSLLLALSLLFGIAFGEVLVEDGVAITEDLIVEYGYDYILSDEVALYLHAFEELPPNYITKDEARDLGWDGNGNHLWQLSYGYSIGGDSFGNREEILPEARGRRYYECDVNFADGKRGAERLVFSNDGLVYYTADHYESFELVYEGWYWEDGWYIWDEGGYYG
ncbi:MAG: ribonuclease [Clostridia bacterium]|nr:ribonuclease [Clostridia bacterium]